MIYRRLAYIMLMIVVEHHSTWGSGFSCDFGTLDPDTGTVLHDCDVTQTHNRGWRVISGNDYPSKYWLDTTWTRNGGFFISWTRDKNGRSVFRLPHFQMSTPFAQLSFYYKIFGTGRNSLRVTLCDDVIFDVTDKKGLWIKSPDLPICCYEGGWNWPEISFEVTWTAQTGRIAVDQISVESDASVQIGYRNDGGSCKVPTSSSPTTTLLLSPTKHPQSTKGEALKATSSSTSSSTSLHSQANYSSSLPHVTITDSGRTASINIFNLFYNSSESSAIPPKGNIGFLNLLKTFPTNVAFLVLTCSLVIVVVLIAVCLTRKYCCSCRRGSKPCEHQVSLATLAKQKEGAEESTSHQSYQSTNEPSGLSLQNTKSEDTPGLSSGEDFHVYSDCVDVRPIPISLRLSAENSHDRCDHPRLSAVHIGHPKTAHKVKSQGPSRMTGGPPTYPKPKFTGLPLSVCLTKERSPPLSFSKGPKRLESGQPQTAHKVRSQGPSRMTGGPPTYPQTKFTGLRPSVCSTKERSPPLSLSKGPEQRESGKEKYGLQRNDLGCVHEYFDMSENSKEGQVDTDILPKMNSATVVRSDMASLDDDGVYENIAKANDEMVANTTSEDPHIYNNIDGHEEFINIVTKTLDCPLSHEDIDRSHRVGKRRDEHDTKGSHNIKVTYNKGKGAHDIEGAHNIKGAQDNKGAKPRSILVKFCSYRKRSEIMLLKKKLIGSGFTIAEDLSNMLAHSVGYPCDFKFHGFYDR
eukprot:XP_011682027.1 PREDICTED: uncharacterized protein LOC105446655 [Strongylocentrotus purpuratus]